MRWRTIGASLIFLACVIVTVWVLHQQFGQTSLQSVRRAFNTQHVPNVVAALVLTALSFSAMALYDVFGVKAVARGRVPAKVALLAGATANSIANTLGFHAFTGGAVRARIYLRQGLSGAEVVRVASLSWLALALGFLAMVALAELARSFAPAGSASTASLEVGLGLAVGLLIFIAWLDGGPRALSVFGFSQPLPSAGAALAQVGIGMVESAAAIGALYVLLPNDLAPPFSLFAVGYIAVVAAGVVAHVPGGIGIFEAGITAMLSGADRADLLAALLVYRFIYNVLPFLLSVAALLLLGYGRNGRLSLKAGTG